MNVRVHRNDHQNRPAVGRMKQHFWCPPVIAQLSEQCIKQVSNAELVKRIDKQINKVHHCTQQTHRIVRQKNKAKQSKARESCTQSIQNFMEQNKTKITDGIWCLLAHGRHDRQRIGDPLVHGRKTEDNDDGVGKGMNVEPSTCGIQLTGSEHVVAALRVCECEFSDMRTTRSCHVDENSFNHKLLRIRHNAVKFNLKRCWIPGGALWT